MHRSLFGTDGIRTAFGSEPLTPKTLIQLGKAIGKWATEHGYRSIALARDTRISGSLIKNALTTGLLQFDVTIHDYGIAPTPVLSHKVTAAHDCGIMITASHNQYQDNGVKIVLKNGQKISQTDAQTISNYYHKQENCFNVQSIGNEQIGNNLNTWYADHLHRFFSSDFLKNKTITVDCAHGAFSDYASDILKIFGAQVHALNTDYNGKNINKACGSLHPEQLVKAVLHNKSDIGIAFDGDGDRLTIVQKDGAILYGDEILALLLHNPAYKTVQTVVGTIMSNQGLAVYCKSLGKTFVRTPVGDHHVTSALEQHNELLGAEPSGHAILRDFSLTSDGLFTALRVCQTLCHLNDWNYKTFTPFFQTQLSLPIGEKKDLQEEPFATMLQHEKEALKEGRMVVRYSGTEPLLRIMTESNNSEHSEIVAQRILSYLKNHLQ